MYLYPWQAETTGEVRSTLPWAGFPPRENCNMVEIDSEIPYALADFRKGVVYLKLGQWV